MRKDRAAGALSFFFGSFVIILCSLTGKKVAFATVCSCFFGEDYVK